MLIYVVLWFHFPGQVGELTLALSDLLWEDMVEGPERIQVPYY